MKISITGGTGFVGRYLIDRLVQNGHQLTCIARDPAKAESDYSHSQVRWLEGDLSHSGWHDDFFADCDAVVHSGLWRSTQSFRGNEPSLAEYLEVNFMGSIRLFERAYREQVNRFVFVSTCAVHEKIMDDRALDEAHPLWATSHYGAHKAAIEKFVHSYGYGNDFPICAIRPTGIYGIQAAPETSKWFGLVQSIVQGKDVSVGKGGKEVHVADVAKGIDLLLQTDQAITGQAYACYDRYISEYDVATIAKEICDSPSQIDGEQRRPKNEIVTDKIEAIGMKFGGETLLRETIAELIKTIKG